MLIKPDLTLIRIQGERWMGRGRERERGGEGGGGRRPIKEEETSERIKNRNSHSSSEPHGCLSRPVTCSEMTHALTGWMCLDASHMKHKRERERAASDLYWSISAKGGSQACMSNSVNSLASLCVCVVCSDSLHARFFLLPLSLSLSFYIYIYMSGSQKEDALTPGSVFCSCSAFWALRADSRAQYVRKAQPGDEREKIRASMFSECQIHALHIMSGAGSAMLL